MNRQLCFCYGFPFGLTICQIISYDKLPIRDKLLGAVKTEDVRVFEKILELAKEEELLKATREAIRLDRDAIVKKIYETNPSYKSRFEFLKEAIMLGSIKTIKIIMEKATSNVIEEGINYAVIHRINL